MSITASYVIDPVIWMDPTLWIDFLNGEPKNSRAIYPVYRKYTRSIRQFKDWLAEEGYYGKDMEDMELMSEDEFLKRYPRRMQADAEELHSRMKEVIDKGKADATKVSVAHEIEDISVTTEDIDVPTLSFTVEVEQSGTTMDSSLLQLHVPAANHHNFWLSVILGGMISSYREGNVARRCAGPNCQKYFIPYPRARNQRFHSPSCRSTFHTKKRYKSPS